jgi:hypothetical protein
MAANPLQLFNQDLRSLTWTVILPVGLCAALLGLLVRVLTGMGGREPRKKRRRDSKSGSDVPLCPLCDSPMVLRRISKGRNVGSPFWGCSGYPECDGTRRKVPARHLP